MRKPKTLVLFKVEPNFEADRQGFCSSRESHLGCWILVKEAHGGLRVYQELETDEQLLSAPQIL